MTIYYYIPRPDVQTIVQWTGSNFSEVQSALNAVNNVVTENNDGTLDYYGTPVAVGQWIIPRMSQVVDDNWFPLYGNMQPVDGAGPHNYTITDAS